MYEVNLNTWRRNFYSNSNQARIEWGSIRCNISNQNSTLLFIRKLLNNSRFQPSISIFNNASNRRNNFVQFSSSGQLWCHAYCGRCCFISGFDHHLIRCCYYHFGLVDWNFDVVCVYLCCSSKKLRFAASLYKSRAPLSNSVHLFSVIVSQFCFVWYLLMLYFPLFKFDFGFLSQKEYAIGLMK